MNKALSDVTLHYVKYLFKSLLYASLSGLWNKPKPCFPVVLKIIFGILIGTLVGCSVRNIYESDNNTIYAKSALDSGKQFKSHNSPVSSQKIRLRCVVYMDSKQKKKENYMSALQVTYMRRCNQTIIFTNSKLIHKKFFEDVHVVYMETWKSEYYWDLYHLMLKQLAKQELLEPESPNAKNPSVEWTIIGNEQLYVIVENLKEYLSGIDPDAPIILGSVTKKRNALSLLFPFGPHTIVSVQAGIVLSRRALNYLQSDRCSGFFFPSATESAIYECAKRNGIDILEPRDQEGIRLLQSENVKALIRMQNSLSMKDGGKQAICCSDHAISFGSLNYKELRLLEYTINKVKVFGLNMV